jgi:WD40 repeat protein
MRTEAAVALLRRTRLFAELREDTLRALADRSVERSYPRHGRLFYQGDPGSGLYVLASGLVRVNFSPDGRNVAATNDDGTVSIWDVDSRRLVGRPLAGHTDLALGVVFVDGGNTLVTSGWDGSLIFWDLRPTPGRPRRVSWPDAT